MTTPPPSLAERIHKAERLKHLTLAQLNELLQTGYTDPQSANGSVELYLRASLARARWHLERDNQKDWGIAYTLLSANFDWSKQQPVDNHMRWLVAHVRYNFALVRLLLCQTDLSIRSDAREVAVYFRKELRNDLAAQAYLLAGVAYKEADECDSEVRRGLSDLGYHFSRDPRRLALMRWALGTGSREYRRHWWPSGQITATFKGADCMPYLGPPR